MAIESELVPFLSWAPGAVASAKALMRDLGPRIDDKTIAMTIDALRLRWECDEAVECIDAFFEKRKASWAL
jgi:methylglutaconyl-CoA hydratase